MRTVQKSALVAVELQLRSDSLFLLLHGQADGVQNQIYRLLCSGFVSDNGIVIEIPDYGQVQYALFGVNVENVCYPFAVGSVCVKLPIEQIFVLVNLLSHLLPFPAPADFRQQIIFLHDPQYGFRIAENILAFQPQPHPPVSVGTVAAFLLLCDSFSKSCVLFRLAQTMDKIVVAATGYTKKSAHDGYRIFCLMLIYNMVFDFWSHLPSIDCRKSRNSSFSIFSLLFSYLYSANVLAGFLPRCLG
ncbi:MAG: hypothetical protein SOR61_02550, partial [Evtepia sp.]|nr:hypothetical protein [Evtepia sp.]